MLLNIGITYLLQCDNVLEVTQYVCDYCNRRQFLSHNVDMNSIKVLFTIILPSADAVFFVDAMSSFGGIPIHMSDAHIDYLVTSANKCLEGVPGFSLAIARVEHLRSCKGRTATMFGSVCLR